MAVKAFSTYDALGEVPNEADTILIYDQSGAAIKQVEVSELLGGWRDMRAPLIGGKNVGVSDPTLTSFGPTGNVYQYAFSVGDEVMLAFHIDHDIKIGSTVYPHVHWSTDGTDTAAVKWELNYTVAATANRVIQWTR